MKTLEKNLSRLSTTSKEIIANSIMDTDLTSLKTPIHRRISNNYKIDIVPDKSLLGRIGESGHTFYEAVAEFIDNSIDAKTPSQKAGTEKLIINIIINVKKKYFSISDNGKGMDKKTLANCARLGHSEKTALELGYAGIGLKSGALTIGNNFIVRTGVKHNPLPQSINIVSILRKHYIR